MRIAIAVLAVLVLAGSEARAGACLGEDEIRTAVGQLERWAKRSADGVDDYNELCLRVAFLDDDYAKLRPRIERACTKVLERDGAKARLCIELAVRLGKPALGGVTLYDAVATWKTDPWEWDRWDPKLWALGQLGDPRGAAGVVEVWRANLDAAARYERKKRGGAMMAWAGWRKEAAATLGAIGGADERAFLQEQAAATKDRYVKKACLAAAAAIAKRLGAQATP